MLIQFLLSFILLGAFWLTWRRARQKAIRRIEALGWSAVWIVAAIVIWRPEVTSTVARLVGVGRGADLVLYASIIALLLLVFNLHVAHDRLERTLTELIRREALESVKSKVESHSDDSTL
jgi:hypothetical protein